MAEASAGASIQLGDVQQSTKCPICLDAFTDPRGLPCKHTYCLQCLHSLQQSNMTKMRCPVCKQLTVPYKDQLDSLPKNEFAEELVRLMHRFENASVTPAAAAPAELPTGATIRAVQPSASEDEPQAVENQLQQYRDQQRHQFEVQRRRLEPAPTLSAQEQHRREMQAGHMMAHNTGFRTFHQHLNQRAASEQEIERRYGYLRNTPANVHTTGNTSYANLMDRWLNPLTFPLRHTNPASRSHHPYQCRRCMSGEPIRGTRFQCSICHEYQLCENHALFNRDHDDSHLLIKIKTPGVCDRTRQHENEMILMSEAAMKDGEQRHRIQVNPGEYLNITCDHCNASPIRGVRFKCAVCDDYDICAECEKVSESFHPTHPFIRMPRPVAYYTSTPLYRMTPAGGDFALQYWTWTRESAWAEELAQQMIAEDEGWSDEELDDHAQRRFRGHGRLEIDSQHSANRLPSTHTPRLLTVDDNSSPAMFEAQPALISQPTQPEDDGSPIENMEMNNYARGSSESSSDDEMFDAEPELRHQLETDSAWNSPYHTKRQDACTPVQCV